jgi:hypothetical protein
MFSLHRPTPDQLRSLAARRATRPLSFRAGLLDRADATPKFPSDPRNGWFVDRCSATIGHGSDEFAAGRDALRRWQQFAPEWTMSMCPPAPMREAVRGDAELDHAVLMQQLSSTWQLGSMATQDR